MLVRVGDLDEVIGDLLQEKELALDFETFGLRTYHGDRMFSMIISTEFEDYYFNFIPYPNVTDDRVLPYDSLKKFKDLFADQSITWYIQNAANFDMGVLAIEGFELEGTIHCTKAIGRVEYNDHVDVKVHPDKKAEKAYSLAAQLFRIKEWKDDKVAAYVEEHKLYTKIDVPGKSKPVTLKHYDKVPFDLIVPYGCQDGRGTFKLGRHQVRSIQDQDAEVTASKKRTVRTVMENERRLQKTIFRMRHVGVRVDIDYCKRAAAYETDQAAKAAAKFRVETGVPFKMSPKLFAEIFASEKEKWTYTDKGNPSFDADALAKFDSPAAKAILEMRDAKSRADFYHGFLYHADKNGDIHPNYNPEGTIHGRFSSSDPNFQNLTSEDEEEDLAKEFVIRRAIIPRPGFVLFMPDYSQMEYKFMLEQACILKGYATELCKLINDGMDFHDATALNVKNLTKLELVRKMVKIVNFMTLYGSGIQNIADTLKITFDQAKKIKSAILRASPEIGEYLDAVKETAEQRGYIVNWLGRRCYFPIKRFAYKAPNYHTSGGCADVLKVGMNKIDETLSHGFKSRLIMTVHDELPHEIHESEVHSVPRMIVNHMEEAYPGRFLKLNVEPEWSEKSLADKVKGYPA